LRIAFLADTTRAVRGLRDVRVMTCSTEHNVGRAAVWEMTHIGPSNGLGPRVVTLGQSPSNEWTTTGVGQPLGPGCYTVYVDAGGAQGAITLDVGADGTVAAGHRQPASDSALQHFVQRFYDWYVPVANQVNKERTSDIALAHQPSVFDSTLANALRKDSQARDKVRGEVVGLDFDPFLAAQDPCERYVAGTPALNGAHYRVNIYGICEGKQHATPDLTAELVAQNGAWVFVNFIYTDGGDLLAMLKNLADDRKKHSSS
jgi:hypothetical protein